MFIALSSCNQNTKKEKEIEKTAKQVVDLMNNREVNKSRWASGDKGEFKVRSMQKEFDKINLQLANQGYSKDDAHNHAMARMLEKHNTGITITVKKPKRSSFKELSTKSAPNGTYVPEMCK